MSRIGNALLGGGVFVVVFTGAWLVLAYKDMANTSQFIEATPAQRMRGVVFEAKSRGGVRRSTNSPEFAKVELQMLQQMAAEKGVHVSDELIAHARNDAPPALNVRYAELPGQEGGRLVCSSLLIEGTVAHFATTYLPNEIQNDQQAMLPEYILSGCAEAIRDRSVVLSSIDYARRMIPLVPAGKPYAGVRRGFENIAAGR
jgi:hypothetical protein